jgi:hypothetical protein
VNEAQTSPRFLSHPHDGKGEKGELHVELDLDWATSELTEEEKSS